MSLRSLFPQPGHVGTETMKLRILGPLQSQLDLVPEPLWASAISSHFKFSALSFF